MNAGPGGAAAVIPPAAGDTYDAKLLIPLGSADIFSFSVTGQRVEGGGPGGRRHGVGGGARRSEGPLVVGNAPCQLIEGRHGDLF